MGEPSRIALVWGQLHGMYGNRLLDTYKTGKVENGRDAGVQTARRAWEHRLAEFEDATVLRALQQCETRHKTFPPTLPEFVDLCKANVERKPSVLNLPAMPTKEEGRDAHLARLKETLAQSRPLVTGDRTINIEGIPTLNALIARALVLAGAGNESRELLALDRRNLPERRKRELQTG